MLPRARVYNDDEEIRSMKPAVKFMILGGVVIGTLAWLAVGGISDSQTYYKTVAEMKAMGQDAQTKRLRVAGDIAPHTIERKGREVRFVLKQEAQTLNVVYNGVEPLPDTFQDGAQAVAEGKLGSDGVFTATHIQAKCASKYEAKPGEKFKGMKPTESESTKPAQVDKAAF
jgi:cytochrome c-type biogenesis protein CcmE